MEVYTKLKNKREEYNYSYEDMARMLNISKCFYWQIENKKRTLYYDLAIEIANIFELKPDNLFLDDYIYL